MMKDLKKLLLLAVLSIVGSVAGKAAMITDPAELSNTKVYTIRCIRGYCALNIDDTYIVSSHIGGLGENGENDYASIDDDARQFGILLINDKYYIYSPRLEQFAFLVGQQLKFVSYAGTALAFSDDGIGEGDEGYLGSSLRLGIPENDFFLNNNGGGNWVLNGYTTPDPGNALVIEEVEGVTLDFARAMEVFNEEAPKQPWEEPHKVYYLSTQRADEFACSADLTTLTGTRGGPLANTDASEEDKQFAFWQEDGKTYLYNVGANLFLGKNGKLTSSVEDFADIGCTIVENDEYPYKLFIKQTSLYFNSQVEGRETYGGGIIFDTWSGTDEGNIIHIEEVAGEDAYDLMQAFFETPTYDITYHLYWEDEEILTVQRNMMQGVEAKLPDNMLFTSCEYEYDPEIIESGDDVRVDVTWLGPELFSKDYESATWFNMFIRKPEYYISYDETDNPMIPDVADEVQRSATQYQWAFVGNPYDVKVYNKAAGEGMTLANSGFDDGGDDFGDVKMREGENSWTIPGLISNEGYDGFLLGIEIDGTYGYINQYGGDAHGNRLSFWYNINDVGSGLFIEEVPDYEVTDVYFDIVFDGQIVKTEKVMGQAVGDLIPDLPASLSCGDLVEFDFDENTTVEEDIHVPVTATWAGPFELSKDFNSAHWYDMAVRNDWYVTSEQMDDDGALITVEANAVGLAEDSYQWALVGDPWNIKLYNKAEGSGVAYAWTSTDNQSIPTFVDASTANVWQLKKCTNENEDYAEAFLFTIPARGYQVNQYGGAGGHLKVWTSTGTNDIGSSFRVFEVPTDFAEFVEGEIAPIMEMDTKWCNFNDAARAAIGYKPEYKESCTFEQYKAMKQALESLQDDIDNYLLPETGYYRLQNKMHGDYINMETDLVNGSLKDTQASTVVKLTKIGDREYTIQTQEEYFQPLERSTTMITDPMTPVTFKIFIPKPGYAAFTGTEEPDPDDTDAMSAYTYSFIHRRNDSSGNNDLVGWERNADATQWKVIDAKSITIETDDNGFTTLYAPFAVQSPEGVSALVGKIESDHLELTGIKGVVPALTPVVLKAEPGTYEMPIVNSSAAPIEGNDLKGILLKAKPGYAMTLEEVDGDMAFYTFVGEAIEANKAYLRLSDTSIEVFPIHVGDLTGIKTVDNDANEHEMYDLSGRRVNKTGKGVYIIDGKKMVVK